MSDPENATPTVWSITKKSASAITVLGVLASALYGITSFVDSRIERALADPRVLEAVASRVRPAVIFDSKNSILANQGGLQYINSIEVVPGDGTVPREIRIRPAAFLSVAPLLESLDEPGLNGTASRGEGTEWRPQITGGGYVESGAVNPRFRLEILR